VSTPWFGQLMPVNRRNLPLNRREHPMIANKTLGLADKTFGLAGKTMIWRTKPMICRTKPLVWRAKTPEKGGFDIRWVRFPKHIPLISIQPQLEPVIFWNSFDWVQR